MQQLGYMDPKHDSDMGSFSHTQNMDNLLWCIYLQQIRKPFVYNSEFLYRNSFFIITVCLIGGFNPSEKYWSDWIIVPTIGENKNVPNNQPVVFSFTSIATFFWGCPTFFLTEDHHPGDSLGWTKPGDLQRSYPKDSKTTFLVRYIVSRVKKYLLKYIYIYGISIN